MIASIDFSNINIDYVCNLAIEAGKGIMEVYNDHNQDFDISYKSDHSPLTKADKIAHKIIMQGLSSQYSSIPILSEEGRSIPYNERKKWPLYWCVDPLDGTKEFIKKNGEFTVNIALISNDKPILGIIYQPTSDVLYFGASNIGSWKKNGNTAPIKIHAQNSKEWVSVGSRSHNSDEENNIILNFPIKRKISVGSSLKFCFIAEGLAQVYCRVGPTMEWDTAAGQAIAENAGAIMTQIDGKSFLYNKTNLLNPGFICKVLIE